MALSTIALEFPTDSGEIPGRPYRVAGRVSRSLDRYGDNRLAPGMVDVRGSGEPRRLPQVTVGEHSSRGRLPILNRAVQMARGFKFWGYFPLFSPPTRSGCPGLVAATAATVRRLARPHSELPDERFDQADAGPVALGRSRHFKERKRETRRPQGVRAVIPQLHRNRHQGNSFPPRIVRLSTCPWPSRIVTSWTIGFSL